MGGEAGRGNEDAGRCQPNAEDGSETEGHGSHRVKSFSSTQKSGGLKRKEN
jgi:hypothetical protein